MKIAVHLTWQLRLLGLVVLSLLLHLLAFAWIDGALGPHPAPASGAPLALRLLPVSAPVPVPAPMPTPAAAPAVPAQTPAEVPAAAPVAIPGPAPALLPAGEAPPASYGHQAPGLAPIQMPGRYRVRPPPSARLTYALTRTVPGRPAEPAGSAQLAWQLEGGNYRLHIDGVLGRFDSEGRDDDAGIAPLRASELGAAGDSGVTSFDRDALRIDSAAGSVPLHPGSQDRASVLMQLAGIGLAEPDQMQEMIEIVVAAGGGVQVVRFEVLGREELETPAGTLAAIRLAQLGQAGERRVEIWLAPERNWLPVQLRVTQADGSIANQLVTAIDTVPAQAPDGM